MKKNLTLNIEVYLPTNVTREIEMPFFYLSKLDKYITMISENIDSDSKDLHPYIKTELKQYSDGEISRYVTLVSQSKLEQIVAQLDLKNDSITADEFLIISKEYTNQIVDWFNKLYSSINNK